MKVPLSWLTEFVDIEVSVEELVRKLTLAGLEIEQIRYVGLPKSEGAHAETKVTGLAWDPEKIVVGEILEVMPHPNADRLVLTRLSDGKQEHTVLTGAPNLLGLKDSGPLETPIKVAYAKEGSQIYDGKQAGWELMTLKPVKIRGVESSSMACSEKELGISDDHGGIIVLDDDAQPGTPLADYMGDVVLDIDILPNIARNANILGVARETAAQLGVPLKKPSYKVDWKGPAINGKVSLDIREPEINPRFVLGLIEDVNIAPSPFWVQRRLRLAGMRPINNVVDATNYAMLEIGQPLHAFDYDVLVERAGGGSPTIITRLPDPGETLTTLDGEERQLDDFTILVADTAGALSIGGVMGGGESEVSESTKRVLLEGAAWDFINIRKTVAAQSLPSEAAYRFERGVHPAMAERGVRRALELMRELTGGAVSEGLIDEYPKPPVVPSVEITQADIKRWLGIELELDEAASLLGQLEFSTEMDGNSLRVSPPDHRLDIGEGVVGKADVLEEVARVYGYDQIPETQIADRIPPQYANPRLDAESQVRDLLASMGLQEAVTYRLTSPAREAKALASQGTDDREYIRLANPIGEDRSALRQDLLASVLEVIARNVRFQERIAIFEIGPVFLPIVGEQLPLETDRLAIAMRGPRDPLSWQDMEPGEMDFYDMTGVIDGLLTGLHVGTIQYEPTEHAAFHPGKCASILVDDRELGVMGVVHPMVAERFESPDTAIVAANLDLEALFERIPERYPIPPVPAFPPVLEDLAFVVDHEMPAGRLKDLIQETGESLVVEVSVFDLYEGEQVEQGKKSLAFSIVYQAEDRTLTDDEVASLREKIVKRLEVELGAKLRDY
ncbi:MAG: phenylalanine--tRNA ligase subunit beta [Anaerolineales bacterium]